MVVSPNSESVAKARKFQIGFSKAFKSEVKLAAFFQSESSSGPTNVDKLTILGGGGKSKISISGADVVIVDDMVDTAGTLSILSKRLKDEGAKHIYVCASHGLFTENSMQKIEEGCVDRVVVTNSLPLPANCSHKVEQLSIAAMLADVILAEHYRMVADDEDDVFQVEENDS